MTEEEMAVWELKFEQKLVDQDLGNDPAHDLAHFRRVVKTAKMLTAEEGATLEVVVPAAWLHDLVNVPKNDPKRSLASRLSATAATEFLRSSGYPPEHLERIHHAIEAHSFSAKIEAKTLEARIVQDADRLDGLGAVGIAHDGRGHRGRPAHMVVLQEFKELADLGFAEAADIIAIVDVTRRRSHQDPATKHAGSL